MKQRYIPAKILLGLVSVTHIVTSLAGGGTALELSKTPF